MEQTPELLDAQRKILDLELQLQKALKERQAERAGRVRAQQYLRSHLASSSVGDGRPSGAYPMLSIGTLRSCFSTRNGTPRQPLLVPLARSRLDLPPGAVPPAALEGLGGYSHCWLLYLFHANTDLQRLWQPDPFRGLRAKVGVPKLDGGRVGVFATRSPHRPSPIGLSVVKVEKVEGRSVYFLGADIVDGTPILDIKPYLPFCDSIQTATIPSWIQEDSATNPFKPTLIEFEPDLCHRLDALWAKMGHRSLYERVVEVLNLVTQVLSTDIRSARQRQQPHGQRRDPMCEIGHVRNKEFGDESLEGGDMITSFGTEKENGNIGVDSTDFACSEVRGEEVEAANDDILSSVNRMSDSDLVEYHLVVEGIDFKYTINNETRQVIVFGADLVVSKDSVSNET